MHSRNMRWKINKSTWILFLKLDINRSYVKCREKNTLDASKQPHVPFRNTVSHRSLGSSLPACQQVSVFRRCDQDTRVCVGECPWSTNFAPPKVEKKQQSSPWMQQATRD